MDYGALAHAEKIQLTTDYGGMPVCIMDMVIIWGEIVAHPTDLPSVYSEIIMLHDVSHCCPSTLVFFVQQYQRQLPALLHLARPFIGC